VVVDVQHGDRPGRAVVVGPFRGLLETINDGPRRGLRLTFEDQGPGITDITLAMKDGYTTGGGLGLGLSGAKRLTNEFAIASNPGSGTRVVITKWKEPTR
jgi:serine/threonine-protein kinase RsbT